MGTLGPHIYMNVGTLLALSVMHIQIRISSCSVQLCMRILHHKLEELLARQHKAAITADVNYCSSAATRGNNYLTVVYLILPLLNGTKLMSKEGYSYKGGKLQSAGLEILEERKSGDQLGFKPSTFCILGRCSYNGATGTPWRWSRRQAIIIATL